MRKLLIIEDNFKNLIYYWDGNAISLGSEMRKVDEFHSLNGKKEKTVNETSSQTQTVQEFKLQNLIKFYENCLLMNFRNFPFI